jgi:hypothetical protein
MNGLVGGCVTTLVATRLPHLAVPSGPSILMKGAEGESQGYTGLDTSELSHRARSCTCPRSTRSSQDKPPDCKK